MPYIPKDRRTHLVAERPETVGELNYAITMLLKGWVERKGYTYSSINDALGALEGAKLEFYRRVATPYEDVKLADSGDVYQ